MSQNHHFVSLLLLLIGAHYLCDYPLQGDFLSKAKNPFGGVPGVPWRQAIFAHAFIHAAAVLWLLHSVPLAGMELLCHYLIDRWKCERSRKTFSAIGQARLYNIDQTLHILCKVVWLVALLTLPLGTW